MMKVELMKTKRQLDMLHFLSDSINYKILKFLLDQNIGESLKVIAKKCGISKSKARYRIQRFIQFGIVRPFIYIPRFELEKENNTFMAIYYVNPSTRNALNDFVDIVEGLTKQ